METEILTPVRTGAQIMIGCCIHMYRAILVTRNNEAGNNVITTYLYMYLSLDIAQYFSMLLVYVMTVTLYYSMLSHCIWWHDSPYYMLQVKQHNTLYTLFVTLLVVFVQYSWQAIVEYMTMIAISQHGIWSHVCYYLAPGGGCEVLFSPGLSVCVCVCVCLSVYLCVRPIFWYFISRLLEEISI